MIEVTTEFIVFYSILWFILYTELILRLLLTLLNRDHVPLGDMQGR